MVCACAVLSGASVFAQQQTPAPAMNTSVKRNSPFSPNPKKKAEIKSRESEIAPNRSEAQSAEIRNTESSGINTGDGGDATGIEQNRNIEFESRSAASKTLEIAKRGSLENVVSVTKKPTEIYKVGAGDVLDIRLLNSPAAKESNLYTVLENGLIDYPLAGATPISVAGLTTEEIETLLKEKVKLYENPEIVVSVRDYASKTVSVLGLVEKPGAKALRREAIPLYVVLAEAIPRSNAEQVTILRGASKQSLVVGLDDSETLVYPDDVIRVGFGAENEKKVKAAAAAPQYFFIGGQVNSAGQKEFHVGMTLTQAILASGGLKRNSARKVVIRRREAEGKLVSSQYDLKLIKDGKTPDPVLQSGDTIEVEN